MQDFRYLTEDFTKCVGEIHRERDIQHEAIDQIMKLMGKCENDMNEKHSLEIAEENEREQKINELM